MPPVLVTSVDGCEAWVDWLMPSPAIRLCRERSAASSGMNEPAVPAARRTIPGPGIALTPALAMPKPATRAICPGVSPLAMEPPTSTTVATPPIIAPTGGTNVPTTPEAARRNPTALSVACGPRLKWSSTRSCCVRRVVRSCSVSGLNVA